MFYHMAYLEAPVYMDLPSNSWFDMQAWSVMDSEEYYLDASGKRIMCGVNAAVATLDDPANSGFRTEKSV